MKKSEVAFLSIQGTGLLCWWSAHQIDVRAGLFLWWAGILMTFPGNLLGDWMVQYIPLHPAEVAVAASLVAVAINGFIWIGLRLGYCRLLTRFQKTTLNAGRPDHGTQGSWIG